MKDVFEKIIARLNRNIEYVIHENAEKYMYSAGLKDGINHALKIVKLEAECCNGVSSDDVCELKSEYKFLSDKYKRVTSCGYEFYDLHHAVSFKFCPYCGRKIKVVEE